MNEVLHHWLPLINSLLHRLSIHPNEHDECRQAALLRLWKSIESGKELSITFVRIRARGAMLDYLAKRTRTLTSEVAVETLPELPRQQTVSFPYLLDELEQTLSPRDFQFLQAMIAGTEQTLGYSDARLRSLKSDLKRKVEGILL